MNKTVQTINDRYGQLLRYLVVGGFTTGINVVVFAGLTQMTVPWFWANICAWIASVLFAFAANKLVVFNAKQSANWLREAIAFFGLRGASLLADTAILFVGITLMHAAPLVVKTLDQIIVIALNYVFSKQIFKQR